MIKIFVVVRKASDTDYDIVNVYGKAFSDYSEAVEYAKTLQSLLPDDSFEILIEEIKICLDTKHLI
jgi:hypothetical protein